MVQVAMQNCITTKSAMEEEKKQGVMAHTALVTGGSYGQGASSLPFVSLAWLARLAEISGIRKNESMLQDVSGQTSEDGHLLCLPKLAHASLLQGDGHLHTY